jgi:cyanophycin synthetase
MEILELHAINGANYWSIQHPQLIVIKLQHGLKQDETDRLLKLLNEDLPAVQCPSRDLPTMVLETALYLQRISDIPCSFGYCKKALNANEDLIVIEYHVERAGIFAAQAAVKVISDLNDGKETVLENYVAELRDLVKDDNIGPTTNYILNEVRSRNIPIRFLNAGSLVALGYGNRQKKIRTAVTDSTSGVGMELAGDKEETKNILEQANVPVPQGIIVTSKENLLKGLAKVKFPLVIKPLNGNHGRGVTTQIYDEERALFGFELASKISREVIVEEFIPGYDHRFLVINYKLVAVAMRKPAFITGNGVNTIAELIDEENKDPRRGNDDSCVLATIVVDNITSRILAEKKLELNSILEKGQELILKDTANISAGGTAVDVTDIIHPYNKFMVERVAKLFRLDICGVDIMTTSVDIPITRETGAVIEVNAGPGIRMHSDPQKGVKRNVAAPIVDMLFPKGYERIPIIAVGGSNYKTEVIRLISELIQKSGLVSGYNSADGIVVNGYKLNNNNCADQKAALSVLFDPMIDIAILNCEDKDIVYSGLSFDTCDTCLIMDPLITLNEFKTREDGLKLRSVLTGATSKKGYVILNANDDLFDELSERSGSLALFTSGAQNDRIKHCLTQGGTSAFFEDDALIVCRNSESREIGKFPDLLPDQRNILAAAALVMTVNDLTFDLTGSL